MAGHLGGLGLSFRRELNSGWWPTAPGQGRSPLGHSPGIDQGPAQQHLDVGIEAAELIGRPPSQGIMDGGINS
jgi:hypothetical protein